VSHACTIQQCGKHKKIKKIKKIGVGSYLWLTACISYGHGSTSTTYLSARPAVRDVASALAASSQQAAVAGVRNVLCAVVEPHAEFCCRAFVDRARVVVHTCYRL
jgi:hypothetical protein